ncbi:Mini-ribonuclease 3 [Clostridium sp. HCP1S3_B4]|uniref:Mini-ribonuclease 3 n=1 Tax=unclassified Clostridium TaxID=2614128 RepID=UPI0016BCD974|nr:ribonuclease III domain-containing protein [Clostridiales bacterium]MDY2729372.1 ribonuclease III domain-containing protein [Clostridium sp.]NLK22514.1 Mini-ribonuclease 3 [Clostridiales bacterium]
MLDDFRTREFSKSEARTLNPLQLAIIGDAVYEVYIRSYILTKHTDYSAHKIHKNAIDYVKAKAQSMIMHEMEEELDEEEMYIFKRGRNAKSATVPKNANVRDYRMATGFEALVGYLYLIGDKKRLEVIFDRGIEVIKK